MVRGEVWWADLGLPRGSAPALRRPVLIVSADQYNRSELSTVTVAAITSNTRLADLPGNVAVASRLGGLANDSVVNVTQVATVDRGVLEQRAGILPDWLMAQVDAGLEKALGLGLARQRSAAPTNPLRAEPLQSAASAHNPPIHSRSSRAGTS